MTNTKSFGLCNFHPLLLGYCSKTIGFDSPRSVGHVLSFIVFLLNLSLDTLDNLPVRVEKEKKWCIIL